MSLMSAPVLQTVRMDGSPVKKRVVERSVSADGRKLQASRKNESTSKSQRRENVIDEQKSSSVIRRQAVTHLRPTGSAKFPKLEDCAHFHYDFVTISSISVCLFEGNNSQDKSPIFPHQGPDDGFDGISFSLQVSTGCGLTPWIIQRTIASLKTLDRQLHRCVYDRKYSLLPCIGRDFCDPVSAAQYCNSLSDDLKHALMLYFNRFSSIAGNMVNCGAVLNWFEMDNRGNRIIVSDTDSAINTPAIGAAHVVQSYVPKALDELSLEVGDIVSIIDMPPAHESSWWRGKNRFEVGFFPSSCVQVIGGNSVPESVGSRLSPVPVKPVLRKRGKLIVRLRAFFSSRPERSRLKRSGIVKERVFGCDLGEHLLNSGHDVPVVLKFCSEIIEMHGVVDGIYRLSGISSNIQRLSMTMLADLFTILLTKNCNRAEFIAVHREEFDADETPTLTDDIYVRDIHCVSSLLKLYFRELPNPLLTYQLYDKFVAAMQETDDRKLIRMHDAIQQLPPPHYRTCSFLMRHLCRMASFGEKTGMTCKNLAIVWAPNLLRCKDLEQSECSLAALKNVGIQAVVTEFLISHAEILFTDCLLNRRRDNSGCRSARPKSLAISTPTKLLSLDEARQKAVAPHSAERQQVYLDVGGGPANLPPVYHTVINLPKGKKWNKIKKSSASSKSKGLPPCDIRPPTAYPMKHVESSSGIAMSSEGLQKPPSGMACSVEEIAAVPVAPASEVTRRTLAKPKFVSAAESSVHTHRPTDAWFSLAGNTADVVSLDDDYVFSVPPSSFKCTVGSTFEKPVCSTGLLNATGSCLSPAVAASVDVVKPEALHSAEHVSCMRTHSSAPACVTTFSQHSTLCLLEPLSSDRHAAMLAQRQLSDWASNEANGDGSFSRREVTEMYEIPPSLQLLSLPDDVPSQSESDSEPLGGCRAALLNPDHCISDLCVEDYDEDSVFDVDRFQSPVDILGWGRLDSPLAADQRPITPENAQSSPVCSIRIRNGCSTSTDMSEVHVASLSRSDNLSSYDRTDPFRSPPKSPLRSLEANSLQSEEVEKRKTKLCPFESPLMFPFSDTAFMYGDTSDDERMINCSSPSDDTHNVHRASFSDSVTDSSMSTIVHNEYVRNNKSQNNVTFTGTSELDSLESNTSPFISNSNEYKSDLSLELSVHCNSNNAAVSRAMHCPPESSVDNCHDKTSNRESLPSGSRCNDMVSGVYSVNKSSKQTSVKLLKCKFETQRECAAQDKEKNLPSFVSPFASSSAESCASTKVLKDITHSSSSPLITENTVSSQTVQTVEIGSANTNSNSTVNTSQYSPALHHAECPSPSPASKSTRPTAGDFKQYQQPSLSARISCFEPVMAVSQTTDNCQKENKRARLSSCDSANPDPAEKILNRASHSIEECLNETCQGDASGRFTESPRHIHAREYRHRSSLGHDDLLALLNIPATSAKNIPRLSERKRMFEVETSEPTVNSSASAGSIRCRSPTFQCSQLSCGPQRLSGMDKENSVQEFSQGRVKNRRSLFEGTYACKIRNDSVDSDSSLEIDPDSFGLSRVKTRGHLPNAVPVKFSAGAIEQFQST